MQFFRLSEKTNSQSREYYLSGIKGTETTLKYVGNIRQLNIIVGANNTRKSRFIRELINTELKVLIESDVDLNKHIYKSKQLFENTEDIAAFPFLIEIYIDSPGERSTEFEVIKRALNMAAGSSLALTVQVIQDIITNILENIAKASLIEQSKNTKMIISDMYQFFGIARGICEHLNGSQKNIDNFPLPIPSNISGIRYNFPPKLGEFDDTYDKINNFLRSVANWILPLTKLNILPHHDKSLTYIPVLRSSRTLINTSKNIFLDTLKEQHRFEENPKLSIETGLDLYEKIERARNGHRAERDNFEAFEKFLSDVFFQSRALDIIAIKELGDQKVVKISIDGDNDDIPIHDLGDGIQSIILLLLPIFTAKDDSWIFIDEPENNLHPGYQNIFIKAITENPTLMKKSLRFFINTHSNHILTEALLSPSEIEILVFSRRDKDSSYISSISGNEQHALEMLGVMNTSILVSNCTIWVEGITDRLYIRGFLKAYCEANDLNRSLPIEGFQYAFIEYAGNNLIHYCFNHQISHEETEPKEEINAMFINSNIFLVADTDFTKEEKHAIFSKIAIDRPNFRYYHTSVPEIENLLPNSILKKWLTKEFNADPEEVQAALASRDDKQKLGALLHDKISKNGTTKKGTKRKFTTTNQGGTLSAYYKSSLADFVHQGINDGSIQWDQLKVSSHLVGLAEQLYSFIEKKNNRLKNGIN